MMPADVRTALDELPSTARDMVRDRLETLCAGDWRRVVSEGRWSFVVLNHPQVTKEAPAKRHSIGTISVVRRPEKEEEPYEVVPFRNTDCPRPEKYVYPTKKDAEERRTTTWSDDPTMNSYLCVCGFWHLGHSRELAEALALRNGV